MADPVNMTAEREISAAQVAAERSVAAERQMYADHPGEGVDAPSGDPEYRRTAGGA